jgi:hypothetical protein
MRIDIAPHKRPRRKPPQHVPDPHHFHIPAHASLHTPSTAIRPLDFGLHTTRHLNDSNLLSSIL